MQETLVRFLGREVPLKKGWAAQSSILGLSWVAMVKNLPAVRETWLQPLGCEDPLEKGMETPLSILAWRIPMDRGLEG